MKKVVVWLVLFASIINLAFTVRKGKITHYSDDDERGNFVFSCGEDFNSCYGGIEFEENYIYCSPQRLEKSDLLGISFDCSFPELNLSQKFQNSNNLQVLDLSNVDLTILKKKVFEVFLTVTEINLSNNNLARVPSNICIRKQQQFTFCEFVI